MDKKTPLVSISMVTYHAEAFISDAIEGVLRQSIDFPIELVIGDDASTDQTRHICETYAAQYPNIVRLVPSATNMGIAANTARTMGFCRGKYIAVCDGDDIWTDPDKLKRQVEFLENNPDFGVVYTDVHTISETGEPVEDPEQESIRDMYTRGEVFFQLLQANFINNSTAVFRRELIGDHQVYPDRSYQIPDHIRWLHIATRAKVHFINIKSTAYRRHSSGLSVAVPQAKILGNRRMLYRSLFNIIPSFDRHNSRPLSETEQTLLFRRMCSLVLRGPGTVGKRLRILRILPKYFPGATGLIRISRDKLHKLLHISFNKLVFASEFTDFSM